MAAAFLCVSFLMVQPAGMKAGVAGTALEQAGAGVCSEDLYLPSFTGGPLSALATLCLDTLGEACSLVYFSGRPGILECCCGR